MNLHILCLIVFIDLLGFGIVAPIFPLAAEQAGATAFWVTFGGSGVYSVLQLASTPLWGGLSDRRGRRLVLVVSMVGSALAYLILAFAKDPVSMVLARALAGAMAGNIAAAYAYTIDISSPEGRTKALGQLGAAFGLGFALGPALGGMLGSIGGGAPSLTIPAVAAAALSFAAAIGAAFILKDVAPILPPATAQGVKPRFGSLFKGRPALLGLVAGVVVFQSMASLLVAVLPLFAAHEVKLDTRGIGFSFFMLGGLAVICQMSMGFISKHISPRVMITFGLIAFGFGLIVIYQAPHLWFMPLGLLLLGVGQGVFSPGASTLFSYHAEPHERGRIMASFNAAGSAGRIIGPMLGGPLFAVAAGLPFYIGAFAVLVIGLPLLAISARPVLKPSKLLE